MKENTKPVQKANKKTPLRKRGLFSEISDSNELMQNFEWDFNRWAKKFYKGNAINMGFEVNGLMNDFLARHPRSKMVCDMRRFKKQLILWCGKNGYSLNPHRAGMVDSRDRVNGFDYFVVANGGFELRHLKRVKLES
jgi:hypothetical protein